MKLDVSILKYNEVVKKYGLFWRSGYGGEGYAMPSYSGAGFNFALIVVLFILLIIVLAALFNSKNITMINLSF